jgi:hypothetical protein
VLDELGWVKPVIVNQRTQHVVDGHLRVMIALRRDEPTVPVDYVDLSEEEEAEILSVLDPIALMAETDTRRLDTLLTEVQAKMPALDALLEDLRAREVDKDLKKVVAANPLPQDEMPTSVWVGPFAYKTPTAQYETWKKDLLAETSGDPASLARAICARLGIAEGVGA